jgi:hypothetical protein
MSEHKSKETLVRLAWIAALRNQGDRQCREMMRQGQLVCALGLLAEITEFSGSIIEAELVVGAMAGLDDNQCSHVACLNDGVRNKRLGFNLKFKKHTFSEIADVIEGWFDSPALPPGPDATRP